MSDNPFETLKNAINSDPEYAWAWQCNLAVPIMDAAGFPTRMQTAPPH
jgi:hypothetical protein